VTTLQILSVAAPIWAATVVMLVVWIENYFDQREMLRENLAAKPSPSLFSNLKETELRVQDVPEAQETHDESEIPVSKQTPQQPSTPPPGIVEHAAKPALVADSEERLRSIISNLEEARLALVESLNPEAAQVLAVSILQLRMRLHRIGNEELTQLSDAMVTRQADKKIPPDAKTTTRKRR
jgi:hypothetical protein